MVIDFTQVPADKAHLDAFVIIHEAAKRGHHLGMISNLHLKLINEDDGAVIQEYQLSQYVDMTAVHLGRFSRTANGWTFGPSGDAGAFDPNQVARAYL